MLLYVKNRLIMTAMGVGLGEHEGKATDDFIAFYARRAQGGCGLIITEITRVTEGHGIGEYDQLSLSKDENIESFSKLADAIHQFDSRIFVQLQHPGRETYLALTGGLDLNSMKLDITLAADSFAPVKLVKDGRITKLGQARATKYVNAKYIK